MVEWHHLLNGHEQAPGDGKGQGSLMCSSPWRHKELDTTETEQQDTLKMKSNQSVPMEISPEYLLEGLLLRLKFQYFGHLMRRTDSFE